MIPARLNSKRLPGKLALNQTGRELLCYSIDNARSAIDRSNGLLDNVVVATDSLVLQQIAEREGVSALLSGCVHRNGTMRVAEVIHNLSRANAPGIVVNLQADYPEIDPRSICTVAEALVGDEHAAMSTVAVKMPMHKEVLRRDENTVKVEFDATLAATRFSRKEILPTAATTDQQCWYRHVGLYAYRTPFLLQYAALPVSSEEQIEDLEQLTALKTGQRIRVASIPPSWAGSGIDTTDDYEAFVSRSSGKSPSIDEIQAMGR